MTAPESQRAHRGAATAASGLWWLPLLTGVLFVILGFVVLSYNTRSVATVSILIGVSFVFTGVNWLVVASLVPELRWWFLVGGILALVAGIISFAYPGETLRILSLLLGWFLLVAGIVDVVTSLTNRQRDLWWLGLVTGIVMFGLGAWSVREDDRSVVLLLTIAGVYCLMRGITELFLAFELRRAKKELAG